MSFKFSKEPVKEISKITFNVVSQEYISKLPIKIQNSELFNKNQEVPAGLFDLKMGVSSSYGNSCELCKNGKNTYDKCPGHFGYIDLIVDIYNPLFIIYIVNLLRILCPFCSHLLYYVDWESNEIKNLQSDITSFIYKNFIKTNQRLIKDNFKCPNCGQESPFNHSKIRYKNTKSSGPNSIALLDVMIEAELNKNIINSDETRKIILPIEAKAIISNIPNDLLINLHYSDKNHPKNMIMRYLPVLPPVARPMIQQSSGQKNENPLTTAYKTIINYVMSLGSEIKKTQVENDKLFGKKQIKYNEASKNISSRSDYEEKVKILTLMVHYLFDSGTYKKIEKSDLQKLMNGLNDQKKMFRQLVSQKEGLIISKVMSKRQDRCARTVISCEVMFSIDQIGVPIKIASILTIPEKVTSSNINRLRLAILNNARYPGARHYYKKDGSGPFVILAKTAKNIVLEVGDVVERHLLNNDIVIMNRQPSLGRYSFLSFRAKIVDSKTFRLPASVCKPFNADFDGDEMNLFLPVTPIAITEAKYLLSVKRNMFSEETGEMHITPTKDTPLSIFYLTQDETFLTFVDFHFVTRLVSHKFKPFPSPTKIVNGHQYWSGRTVFSYILPKFSMNYYNDKLSTSRQSDKNIIIKNGLLISGVINVNALNKIYERINNNDLKHDLLFNFVNDIAKLSCAFTVIHGASCGIDDIYLDNKEVKSTVQSGMELAKKDIRKYVKDVITGKHIFSANRDSFVEFGMHATSTLDSARIKLTVDNIIPYLRSKSEKNQYLAMSESGSAGSDMYLSRAILSIGSQLLNGKIIPFTFNGRMLPYFRAGDLEPENFGFIESSLVKGMTIPGEFVSAVSGRRGKADQKDETANAGYMAKRTIRNTENIVAREKSMIKLSGGEIIQLVYGVDGFSPGCTLQNKYIFNKIDFNNVKQMVQYNDSETTKYKIKELADIELQTILDDREYFYINYCNSGVNQYLTSIPLLAPLNISDIITQIKDQTEDSEKNEPSLTPYDAIKMVTNFIESLPKIISNDDKSSEAIKLGIKPFIIYLRSILYSKNISFILKLTSTQLKLIFDLTTAKIRSAMVEYGSMIGINAATSIAHFLTQLTIDSFHFSVLGTAQETSPLKRLTELVGATSRMEKPFYNIMCSDDSDSIQILELLNSIESFYLKDYYEGMEIIYFKNIKKSSDEAIKEYFKSYPNPINPEDYNSTVLKVFIKRKILYQKGIDLNYIKAKIENFFPNLSIIVSDSNIYSPYLFIFITKNLEKTLLKKFYNEFNIVYTYRNFFSKLINFNLADHGYLTDVFVKDLDYEIYNKESQNVETVKKHIINGINREKYILSELLTLEHTNPYYTTTNDIKDVYQTFGVEAAKKKFIEEFMALLIKANDKINKKHIIVFADSLFRNGIQLAASSEGLRKSDTSLVGLLTFERLLKYITIACRENKETSTDDVASSILTSQIPKYGGLGKENVFVIKNKDETKQNKSEENISLDEIIDFSNFI